MLGVKLCIPELDIEFEMFAVKVSKEFSDEVLQAVRGELWYNKTDSDFTGLIYETKTV